MKRMLMILLTLALLLTCGSAAPEGTAAEGDMTPGAGVRFETAGLDGSPVKSEELFSGSGVTLLVFWRTDDPSCPEAMPELDRLNREYAEQGLRVIGIVLDAGDSEEAAEKAREISGLYSIRTLAAPEGMGEGIAVPGTFTVCFVDGAGRTLTGPVAGGDADVIISAAEAFLRGGTVYIPAEPDGAGGGKQTWTVRATDLNGDPVPEVIVSFCTDTACTMVELDENGTGAFTGPAARYHVLFVDVPDGYDADAPGDLYTGESAGSIFAVIPEE